MPLSGGRILIAAVLAYGIASAKAQDGTTPPASAPESVTVTGVKVTDAAVAKFVEAMTVATRAAGKLARWKDGVCPLALGVPPDVGMLMVRNIRAMAAKAGAPVNPSDSCANNVPGANNIEVIFTGEPQALLDNIRIMHPNLLGWVDNSAEAEKLATMRAPIQAWYVTASVDRHGQSQIDGAHKGSSLRMTMMLPQAGTGGPPTAPSMLTLNLPDATTADTTGGRLGDGMSSAITNVVIVADSNRLLGREMNMLADYIAMLALSQIEPPASCQDVPTILNLLVSDCSRAGSGLSTADIAFLQALYKITPTANVSGQRDEMAYQMTKALAGNNR